MGSKLCSDPFVQRQVNELRNVIINKKLPSGFPFFEEYAFIAKRTPFYAFDNPEFMKIGTTAFTDGRAIYFCKDFIQACFDHDLEMKTKGIKSFSALFLALHELKHILERDFERFITDKVPHDILNIGQDIHNNLQLKYNLHIPLANGSPLGIGYGLSRRELELYGGLTSDSICLDLFREAVNQQIEMMKQQTQQSGQEAGQSGQEPGQSGQEPGQSGQEPGQSGQEPGQSGQEAGQSGQEPGQSGQEPGQSGQEPGQSGQEPGQSGQEPSQSGKGSGSASQIPDHGTDRNDQQLNGTPSATDNQTTPQTAAGQLANEGQEAYGNLNESLNTNKTENHIVTAKDIQDAAEQAGLSDVAKDRIGVRGQLDLEQIERQTRDKVNSSIIETEQAHSKLTEEQKKQTTVGDSKGAYSRKLQLSNKAIMSWDAYAKEIAYLGAGVDMSYTEDVLMDGFFTDPNQYGGILVPEKKREATAAMIMDTSGSMNRRFIANGFNETLEAIESGNIDEFMVFAADTDICDTYWICNKDNVDQVRKEVMDLGGGGTDFSIPIKNVIEKCEEEDKDILFISFFTDLDCSPPNFEWVMHQCGIEQLPPIIFITDEKSKSRVNRFDQACGEYARCFQYHKGVEINLDEIQETLDDIKRQQDELNQQQTMGM